MKFATLILFVCTSAAHAGDWQVLARYSNWYHGDSSAFANCLVTDTADVITLIDGVAPAMIQPSKATPAQMKSVRDEMEKLKPITDGHFQPLMAAQGVTGAVASQLYARGAVHGFTPGPGYGPVAAGSPLENALKEICGID